MFAGDPEVALGMLAKVEGIVTTVDGWDRLC
jgi:hypothetical protein